MPACLSACFLADDASLSICTAYSESYYILDEVDEDDDDYDSAVIVV